MPHRTYAHTPLGDPPGPKPWGHNLAAEGRQIRVRWTGTTWAIQTERFSSSPALITRPLLTKSPVRPAAPAITPPRPPAFCAAQYLLLLVPTMAVGKNKVNRTPDLHTLSLLSSLADLGGLHPDQPR